MRAVFRRTAANRDVAAAHRHYTLTAGILIADGLFAEAKAIFFRPSCMHVLGTRDMPGKPLYAVWRYLPDARRTGTRGLTK